MPVPPFPKRSLLDVLDKPWNDPQGTENELKRIVRAAVAGTDYPDDLSRCSPPNTGSLSERRTPMPIRNRPAPFKLRGR